MFPTATVVTAITSDRLREAETARVATDKRPRARRRARRLRALATRVAYAALR